MLVNEVKRFVILQGWWWPSGIVRQRRLDVINGLSLRPTPSLLIYPSVPAAWLLAVSIASFACVLSRLCLAACLGERRRLPSFLCAPTPNVAVTEVDGGDGGIETGFSMSTAHRWNILSLSQRCCSFRQGEGNGSKIQMIGV